jgi:hypothetical protein
MWKHFDRFGEESLDSIGSEHFVQYDFVVSATIDRYNIHLRPLLEFVGRVRGGGPEVGEDSGDADAGIDNSEVEAEVGAADRGERKFVIDGDSDSVRPLGPNGAERSVLLLNFVVDAVSFAVGESEVSNDLLCSCAEDNGLAGHGEDDAEGLRSSKCCRFCR